MQIGDYVTKLHWMGVMSGNRKKISRVVSVAGSLKGRRGGDGNKLLTGSRWGRSGLGRLSREGLALGRRQIDRGKVERGRGVQKTWGGDKLGALQGDDAQQA